MDKTQFKFKLVILSAGLFVLLLHFSLVIIYANPFASGKNKASYLAFAYVYPFFHQNWNLFAPVPDSNYRLLAQYDNGEIQRLDIFNEILAKHQQNRLLGYEPMVIAFSNTIHYFEKNTTLQKTLNGPVKNDPYFTMLEYAAGNYLRYTKRISHQPVRLILVVENRQTKANRVYFN